MRSARAAPRSSARCRGRRIEALRRRGKYLIAELDGERYLVMHLRMTGNLLGSRPDDDRRAGRTCACGSSSTTATGSCSSTSAGSAPAS